MLPKIKKNCQIFISQLNKSLLNIIIWVTTALNEKYEYQKCINNTLVIGYQSTFHSRLGIH